MTDTQQILIEGKTKIVVRHGEGTVRLIAKDDITAGDGKMHDIIPGKGISSTTTTVRVFKLLKRCGFPVAYIEQDSPTSFIAPECRMLPWEVVVRGKADGSYLKRYPTVPKWQNFSPETICEFYLKTKGKQWLQYDLLCDDPLARFRDTGHIELFQSNIPRKVGQHFLLLRPEEVYYDPKEVGYREYMETLAKAAFTTLRLAWELLGLDYIDFKIEFGIDENGRILIADVIDNDSGRLTKDGIYLDKQVYRDGGDLELVARNYQLVADLTRSFPAMLERQPRY